MWSMPRPSDRLFHKGASLVPESGVTNHWDPWCEATRRGGIGDHLGNRARSGVWAPLGVLHAGTEVIRCINVVLRRVRWRRPDATPDYVNLGV